MEEEVQDEAEEGGRVATREGEEATAVLTVFASFTDPARAGDGVEVAGEDLATLDLEGVDGADGLGRLTLTASALCGKGLIGLSTLSAPFGESLCSPSSSSEVLNRLRVPAWMGESCFLVGSTIADLGLYFGKAEEEPVLERRVERLEGLGGFVSGDLTPCSSEDVPCLRRVDCLLRVIVLKEGLSSFPCSWGVGDFDLLDTVAALMRLRRREGSLAFFAASRESLLITSARAFPTEVKLREWRRDARVGREDLEASEAMLLVAL